MGDRCPAGVRAYWSPEFCRRPCLDGTLDAVGHDVPWPWDRRGLLSACVCADPMPNIVLRSIMAWDGDRNLLGLGTEAHDIR